LCVAINQHGCVVEGRTEEMDPQETEYISLLSVVMIIAREIVKEYFRFAKMINCGIPLTQESRITRSTSLCVVRRLSID